MLNDWMHHESVTRAETNTATGYIPPAKPIYKDGSYIIKDGIIYKIEYDLTKMYGAKIVEFKLSDFIKLTNADRIRAMSDEELARWIVMTNPQFCFLDRVLGWLKEEVDDG